jgi:hypothetical protein
LTQRALVTAPWAVMSNMESVADPACDTSSLSLSLSAGAAFVQESIWLRLLHVTTLLLLAFQVPVLIAPSGTSV